MATSVSPALQKPFIKPSAASLQVRTVSHWGVKTSPASPRHRPLCLCHAPQNSPAAANTAPQQFPSVGILGLLCCPTPSQAGLDWSRLNKSPLTWQHQLQWWEAGTDLYLLSTWLRTVAFKCLLSNTLQSLQICCSLGKFHPSHSALTEETIPRILAGTGILFFAIQNHRHLHLSWCFLQAQRNPT